MINDFQLRNFKCFSDATFSLGKITLLAGLNGTGKSSVIQGLLAFRHFASFPMSDTWRGPLLDVGSFGDVLHTRAQKDQIELKTRYVDGAELCNEITRDAVAFYVDGCRQTDRTAQPDTVAQRSLLRESMFYLSADRLGPRKMLPFMTEAVAGGTPFGKRGEGILRYMGQHEGDLVASALRHPDAARTNLLTQSNAWLAAVSPGVELTITPVPEADLAVAGYSFRQRSDVRTKPFRATNVGFGVSYALPVVVALLAAQRDDLVIIENPEAHLHPGGQTSIAELAVRAAADGRQVVLETHSDHVLDGIRLAVARKIVRAEDVAVAFNELSAEAPAESRWEGRRLFEEMIRAAVAVADGRTLDLVATRNMHGMQGVALGPGYSVSDWLRDGDRDLRKLFYKITTKTRLGEHIDNAVRERFYASCFFIGSRRTRDRTIEARGLGLAYLLDGIAASLASDQQWCKASIGLAHVWLDNEAQEHEENGEVANVSRPANAEAAANELYRRWKQETRSLQESASHGRSIANVFRHLAFGADVGKQFDGLATAAKGVIWNKLIEFDGAAREWRREGGSLPSLAGVRSEGSATMAQFGEERAHRSRHGKKETYKLHVSAGSCRIHFRVESAARMLEIGYVGRHLPTKQFH